jgi:ADP-ribose pyrophosphatase YjhB (NUDIX family)
MITASHKIFLSANSLLIRDGKIFLLRRFNTGWSDGLFTIPSGHVNAGEKPSQAAIRETFEEAGVKIDPKDLKAIACMHRKSDREYIEFTFIAEKWSGEPENKAYIGV